jgi:hypothetical protein
MEIIINKKKIIANADKRIILLFCKFATYDDTVLCNAADKNNHDGGQFASITRIFYLQLVNKFFVLIIIQRIFFFGMWSYINFFFFVIDLLFN